MGANSNFLGEKLDYMSQANPQSAQNPELSKSSPRRSSGD